MARTLWLVLATTLVSCQAAAPSFQVLGANYRYDQGRYQEAVAGYFKALEHSIQTDEIYYNLGTAYNALGEAEPALEMWSNAIEMGSNYLKSYAHFNQGVVYYQLNQYSDAIKSFRQALIISPSDITTKINLEIALIKSNELKEQSKNEATQRPQSNLSEQQSRTLDYLKRREVFFWNTETREGKWVEHQDDW